MAGVVITFCFDVACPYSYLASERIEELARRSGTSVEWYPVVLEDLRTASPGPTGEDGRSLDAASPAKQRLVRSDLLLQACQAGISLQLPAQLPAHSRAAQQLLAAADSALRPRLAQAVFRRIFCPSTAEQRHPLDPNDPGQVIRLVQPLLPAGIRAAELLAAGEAETRKNTEWAASRGAFGVPTFFVAGRSMQWGFDRMFFVEDQVRKARSQHALPSRTPPGLRDRASPLQDGDGRIWPRSAFDRPGVGALPAAARKPIVIRYWFDVGSPWAFLGLPQLVALRAIPNCRVELRPVYLGGLLALHKTPGVPMERWSQAKRAYYLKDLQQWKQFWGCGLRWNSRFPVHSILAMRLIVASGCDWGVVDALCRAAWQQDLDMTKPELIRECLLQQTDLDGDTVDALLKLAVEPAAKRELQKLTQEAAGAGIIGTPTFQVWDAAGRQHLLWGQDRIQMVADMAMGWVPDLPAASERPTSRL